MKKYYSLVQNSAETDIYIYGDITSWEWSESDASSYTLSKTLESLEADTINVYINSYGGEVAEGLAIYNALKRHKAKIKTFADGFACSIASVIFMAGDERIMSNASLLMIHNAWTYTAGNAAELRKQADDLDVITQASVNAYMAAVNITEEEVKQLLDSETWLSPQDALAKGFATEIINETTSGKVSASARDAFFAQVFGAPKAILRPTGKSKKRTVSIDFDGCLCENKYPEIGEPNQTVIAEAKAEKESGSRLILWSCRTGDRLEAALKACEGWGLTFDAVNENTQENIEFFGSDTRKVAADEYWDDKAVKKTFTEEPPENKAINFLNALMGGKD